MVSTIFKTVVITRRAITKKTKNRKNRVLRDRITGSFSLFPGAATGESEEAPGFAELVKGEGG
jgi:hypothetical protein